MVFNTFDTYCSAVCVMVRQKRCHALITNELTAHMEDHVDALLAKGADPDEARRAAVTAMGDPYELGKQLDKLYSPWYPRLTRVFTVLAVLILLVSAVIRFNSLNPYPTFSPFADTAALALDPDVGSTVWDPTQDWPENRLATGTVTGGGTVGPYTFSGGHAAFYRHPFEDGLYRLDVVVTSLSPWFWLEGYEAPYTTALLRSGEETIQADVMFSVLPESGVFRRFYRLMCVLEEPIPPGDSLTLELGDDALSYTIRLEEVALP